MAQTDAHESQSRPRLLLRSSSSRQAEGRVRVTHKPQMISLLKKLPLVDKLKRNAEIEESNTRIRLANSNKEDPATWEDTASLITVTSQEFEGIHLSPTLFEKLKDWIPDYVLMNMERRNRTEVQGTKRARDNAGPASKELPVAKNPRFMPDIIEKSRSRIGPVEVRIHDGLWDLAKHHRYLHLALFTDRNLTFINNHWTSFKSAKVLIGATKTTLPVLKDITDQLGLPDPEVDSTEGLSYPSFQQAVKNYYSFEKERDKNGAEGTRARWTQNHFMFFINQHNAEAYYHFWKPREYRLRMERQDYDLGFEIGSYEMQWALVEEEARCHFDSTTPEGSYSPHHSSDTDEQQN